MNKNIPPAMIFFGDAESSETQTFGANVCGVENIIFMFDPEIS